MRLLTLGRQSLFSPNPTQRKGSQALYNVTARHGREVHRLYHQQDWLFGGSRRPSRSRTKKLNKVRAMFAENGTRTMMRRDWLRGLGIKLKTKVVSVKMTV